MSSEIDAGDRRARIDRDADWIPVAAAVRSILDAVAPLGTEAVPLADALGRVLAEPIDSPIDQPPWDNSAMDGFAARAADVMGASADRPVVLSIVDSIPAGGFPRRELAAGQAARIMTGAPVPTGADCVIRAEHTRAAGGDRIAITDDSDASRNVRHRGEDIRRGSRVLEPGRRLRPAELGLLATVGRAQAVVHRRPRVALLSTGDELVDLDAYAEAEAGRRIVNSNGYALAAAVVATGGTPLSLGIARDDASSLRERVEPGLEADALVTTAGASVGEHDLVKDVLEAIGMRLHFWRVRMRPGSPASFGTIARDGRAALPVFGLPGNPVSALVTFEVLVRPALRRLAGRTAVHTRTVRVRTAEPMPARGALTHFLRVKLETRNGELLARLTGPQGSGLLTSMTEADALLVVPADSQGLAAGVSGAAIRLDAGDDAQPQIGYS